MLFYLLIGPIELGCNLLPTYYVTICWLGCCCGWIDDVSIEWSIGEPVKVIWLLLAAAICWGSRCTA